ncbi:MAG TPA: hypothetical protein VGA06_02375 [Candidatus Paceibacterota bacterium]
MLRAFATTIAAIFLVLLLFPASSLFAQGGSGTSSGGSGTSSGGSGGGSGTFTNPLAFGSLAEFLTALLGVIVQIGFPIVVLAIIWTGFLFVQAQGKPEDLKTAKKALFWTLIGSLLVLGAFALSTLIQGTVDQIT